MVNIKPIRNAWQQSAPLTAASILMSAAFLVSVTGLLLDHRIVTGAPAWLKPAKFAISTAIYAGTLAWLFRYLTVWPRFTRAMGWVIAVVIVLEVGIIDAQAARGAASHFNLATPLDFVLFQIMGAAIGVLWLASIGILIALFRQRFTDPAWGWSLRLGMLITVLGAATGGLMLRTTPEQAAAARNHQTITANGGHTVGAPDGGPGLPGVGWSKQHGDLRVPHFFGLHGIQIVPFLAWLARRRRRLQTVFTAAASYLAFISILTWQALRGQSIIAPDAVTLAALALWLAGTAAAGFFLQHISTRDSISRRTAVTV
jgi:hypothetical protein